MSLEKSKFDEFNDKEFQFIMTSISQSLIARTAFTNERPDHWRTVLNEIEKSLVKRGMKEKLELL
jgi:hypothetical protein